MLDFKTFKKNSGQVEILTKKLEEMNNSKKFTQDADAETYWTPTLDRAGNGFAVIRFLPAPHVDGDDGLPWVRYWDHFFQGPTSKYYVEKSLTTLGQNDPASEYNNKLWNTNLESNQKIARDQKRRLNYVSNIEVIKDPKKPECEGKVYRFKYGKKVMEKITAKMNPEFEGEEGLNVFDFWKGANFKLKIRQKGGFRNYDDSEFDSPSVLFDDDKELERIWKTEYSLSSLIAKDKFKSYDQLKEILDRVMGFDTATYGKGSEANHTEPGPRSTTVAPPKARRSKTAEEVVPQEDPEEVPVTDDTSAPVTIPEDDDEADKKLEALFSGMASED